MCFKCTVCVGVWYLSMFIFHLFLGLQFNYYYRLLSNCLLVVLYCPDLRCFFVSCVSWASATLHPLCKLPVCSPVRFCFFSFFSVCYFFLWKTFHEKILFSLNSASGSICLTSHTSWQNNPTKNMDPAEFCFFCKQVFSLDALVYKLCSPGNQHQAETLKEISVLQAWLEDRPWVSYFVPGWRTSSTLQPHPQTPTWEAAWLMEDRAASRKFPLWVADVGEKKTLTSTACSLTGPQPPPVQAGYQSPPVQRRKVPADTTPVPASGLPELGYHQ